MVSRCQYTSLLELLRSGPAVGVLRGTRPSIAMAPSVTGGLDSGPCVLPFTPLHRVGIRKIKLIISKAFHYLGIVIDAVWSLTTGSDLAGTNARYIATGLSPSNQGSGILCFYPEWNGMSRRGRAAAGIPNVTRQDIFWWTDSLRRVRHR